MTSPHAPTCLVQSILVLLLLSLPQLTHAGTVEDVVRAWQRREKDTQSLQCQLTVKDVVVAKTRQPVRTPTTPKPEMRPDKDEVLHQQVTYRWKPGKTFYAEHGGFWSPTWGQSTTRDFLMNLDGRDSRRLITDHHPKSVCPLGVVQYDETERKVELLGTIRTLVLIHRPLSGFLAMFDADETMLRHRQPHATESPDANTSVCFSPGKAPQLLISIWTDPDHQHLPVRWTEEHAGQLVNEHSIDYREQDATWIPVHWRSQTFRNRKLVNFGETTITMMERNTALDDGLFAIEFPYGTWVNEYDATSQKTYLALTNGKRRYLSKDEADVRNYKELLAQRSWRPLTITVLIATAGLAFVVFLYRRRRPQG